MAPRSAILSSQGLQGSTSSGGRGLAVQADVANPEDVKQLFEKTLKAFGQIDVVVNNAGIMPLSPIAKGARSLAKSHQRAL